MNWVIIGLLVAAIPIWKDPGWEGGISAYEAFYNLSTHSQKEHISVEQATLEARQAWESCYL